MGDRHYWVGQVLMGRAVREAEGVQELYNADIDGNGRMTGDEFIDFNCKRLISHLGEAEWGRVPGMIGLCVQRLRCQTARNIPAFPISSMVKSRRHGVCGQGAWLLRQRWNLKMS